MIYAKSQKRICKCVLPLCPPLLLCVSSLGLETSVVCTTKHWTLFVTRYVAGIATFTAELPCWHVVSTRHRPCRLHQWIIFDVAASEGLWRKQAALLSRNGFPVNRIYTFVCTTVNAKPTGDNSSVVCYYSNRFSLHKMFHFYNNAGIYIELANAWDRTT
jgi:hypothetical protein